MKQVFSLVKANDFLNRYFNVKFIEDYAAPISVIHSTSKPMLLQR